MIQYGAHIYVFTNIWNDQSLHYLDTAKTLGLDVLELSVGDDIDFDTAKTRAAAEAIDLTLTVSPGGIWPVQCDLSSDEISNRDAGLIWHPQQVDKAANFGAIAYAGALYGHPGVIKRRIPPHDEYHRTVEGLHMLAEYASQRDVKIVLEPMSHFRTHLVNTPAQLLELITLADHPNLFALVDTYHIVTEVRDYYAALMSIAPKLWAVHACENDRGVPGGGLVPWNAVFSALAAMNFQGMMLMETYNSSIDNGAFAYSRGMFHDPCPDGPAFITQGLKFLKRQEQQHFGISGEL